MKKNQQFIFVGGFVMTILLAVPMVRAQESVGGPVNADGTVLPEIIVQENRGMADANITGFSGVPLRAMPMSSQSISATEMQAEGIHRLSDVTRVDASTTDSYNATGYWDIISVRGFTLDNRANYFRESLPISAETSIPLDNKERVEILKGLSGLQSGAAAPGGIINYVVKRPTDKDLRSTRLELNDRGDVLLGVDVGGRIESAPQIGYRLNLAQEKLATNVKDTAGSRSLASLAMDWKLAENSLLETEVEWSKRSQPSRAGFSLLGSTLPSVPADPNVNLNNQAWSQPVVFDGLTATARFSQKLNSLWSWSLIAGLQNLKTDDRLAYPFGCSAENNYDRYCSNGTYDMYDYRSENEHRDRMAGKLSLQGQVHAGETLHKINLGLASLRARERFQNQAYNLVGVGNIEGTAVLPQDPRLLEPNTNRDSTNFDVFAFDNIGWNRWNLWLGARSSQIHRESLRTDGSRPIAYDQHFISPWGALSYDFDELLIYFSASQGVESFVTPNKAGYATPGEFVPDVTSKQLELGVRGGSKLKWSAALFQIKKPMVEDQSPLYQIDGEAKHEGLELETSADLDRWELGASAMLLKAVREKGTLNPALNGMKPTNVPSYTLRLNGSYLVPGVADLKLNSRITQEGPRAVTPDNSLSIPAWTRWDLGVSYAKKWGATNTLISFTVENLTDQRYWREAPTQYGHIYLYPGETRSFWLSLQASL